ncbi:MAG: Omp28-related outer membrane protein, partial [Bacteroidota bacterium]
RMSLFLIENNIADSQETQQGVDPNYLHQHVLRSNFTAPTGNIISAEEKAQSSFCNTYEIILEDNWKVEDLKVIAFIHKGGDAIEVLQAYEVSVL